MGFACKAFLSKAFVSGALMFAQAICSPLLSAATPGTRILNQAEAFVFVPETASSINLLSEQVIITVIADIGISLQSDESLRLAPGSAAIFSHTLTNPGNEASDYELNFDAVSGDNFDLLGVQLFRDLNNNGFPDSGEPQIANGSVINLGPGESTGLVFSGVVPGQRIDGDVAVYELTASIPGTPLSETVTDIVTVEEAFIQLTKSASRSTAIPSDLVVFTLNLSRPSAVFDDILITIDGVIQNAITIRDEIPRNTTFSRIITTSGMTPLYHLSSSSNDQDYTATLPTDLRDVEAVAFALDADTDVSFSSVSFEVEVNELSSGSFDNQAFVFYRTDGVSENQVSPSNLVTVDIPITCPDVVLFTDETFTLPTQSLESGAPLFIQVEAPFLNVFSTVPDVIDLELSSEGTGDFERIAFVETGANTGVFRRDTSGGTSLSIPSSLDSSVAEDGTVQITTPDVLVAIVRNGCQDALTQFQILIDPAGIVFDSRTGDRISGAQVTLIDVTGSGNAGNAGGPATVFDFDGVTPAPSTLITSVDGVFQFPRVAPSTYRIDVIPPGEYTFPSVVPEPLLPTIQNPNVTPRIQPGSFNDSFPVNFITGDVFLDIPLDLATPTGFTLEKEVNRTDVEIGDSVQYQLTITNAIGFELPGTFIDDLLPEGVTFISGTARLDGEVLEGSAISGERSLRFEIGNIEDGETAVLTYRARVEFGAERGDGINRAQAISRGPVEITSNQAFAQIEISQGVFADEGVIFGKVFVDLNNNKIHDSGPDGLVEPVVPGVRLFLEDGTYAITDVNGKYSIYEQRAINHVIKVDTYTLPSSAQLGIIDSRNANDPDSRFVDLRKGELHKANFRLIQPTESVLEAIQARIDSDPVGHDETERALSRDSTFEDREATPERINSNAEGTVEGRGGVRQSFQRLLPADTLNAGNSRLPARPVNRLQAEELEVVLQNLSDNKLKILGLEDGDTVPFAQTSIQIAGHAKAVLKLMVNGVEVPASRIGKRLVDAARSLQTVEYIGVPLKAGRNTVELVQYDGFGNPRGNQKIMLLAPDSLTRLVLTPSQFEIPADGSSRVQILVRAEDRNGTLISARTPLTLESSLGQWNAEDLNENEPGVQVFMTGGEARFSLQAPSNSGNAKVVVSNGLLRDQTEIHFLPDLRPLIINGILDGRLDFNDSGSDAITPVFDNHGFQEELGELSNSGNGTRAEGRAAFYLKGQIKGDILLTAAYDSDKDDDTELFRDIDPDAFYPIYGDSSIRGFDAQSSEKLYVRLDKKRSFLLWGDFDSRVNNEAVDFGNYNRNLNGFEGRYENRNVQVNAFAARTSAIQVVEEFPANGTSGPFGFSASDGILNSEIVEILTRDRNQTSIILDQELLTRYTDYEFEPFTGNLLLRRSVPRFDSNLNPISIRVTFESDSGGEEHSIYGINGQARVHERIEVGGSYVHDENPEVAYELKSVNVTVELAEDTFLIAEAAESDEVTEGSGLAGRAEIRHNTDKTNARLYYAEAESEFFNPTATLRSGRREAGLEFTHRLNEQMELTVEAIHDEDEVSGFRRSGIRSMLRRSFGNKLELGVGGRFSNEEGKTDDPFVSSNGDGDVASAIVSAAVPVPYVENLRIRGEYEQDVTSVSKRRLLGGLDYQLNSKTRLYGAHEFINSLGNEFSLDRSQETNRTFVGIESDYIENGQYFNEYRIRDSVDGPQAEGSIGLRNQWQLIEGLRLNTSLENIIPMSGGNTAESTAITVAAEYTAAENWKASSRLEWRTSDTVDSWLNTLGYTYQINNDWSLLTKSYLFDQKSKTGGEDLLQYRLQTGMAWRQKDKDVWNALFLYEFKWEDGLSPIDTIAARRQVHLGSATVNYQPSEDWTFTNRLALKWVNEQSDTDDFDDTFGAYLWNGRIKRDLNDRWELAVNYAMLVNDSSQDFSYSFGPEVGLWLREQIWLGIGYNFWGFVDEDLDASGHLQSGFFINFSLKFDEGNFVFDR